jgi:ribose 1,5-bisphosphokinase PhnN
MSIFVVGASCSGKTTLVNSLRNPEFEQAVVLPKRFVTRPRRQGDDALENVWVDTHTLSQLAEEGQVGLVWSRDLGNVLQQYAFEKVDPQEGRLTVYSANSSLIDSYNAQTEDKGIRHSLKGSLVVMIGATRQTRANRMLKRSPDFELNEAVYRLDAKEVVIRENDGLRVVTIENNSNDPAQAIGLFRAIVLSEVRSLSV